MNENRSLWISLAAMLLILGCYHFFVLSPRLNALESAQSELTGVVNSNADTANENARRTQRGY